MITMRSKEFANELGRFIAPQARRRTIQDPLWIEATANQLKNLLKNTFSTSFIAHLTSASEYHTNNHKVTFFERTGSHDGLFR